MAVEPKRGCGFRKIGGTYLEADPCGFPCGRMPLVVKPCPVCTRRPKFSRGIQRIKPDEFLYAASECAAGACEWCPLERAMKVDEAALMWVGGKFYTAGEFTHEAATLGVSKRIGALPRWFVIGETWVFLAHEQVTEEACGGCDGVPTIMDEECEECGGRGKVDVPAVFHAFQPARIVRIVGDDMSDEEIAELESQGFTVKVVPSDDPDHKPGGNR